MTKEVEYIEIKMCNLAFQKILEQKECYIKLHQGVLEYKHQFLGEEPVIEGDWSGGKKEVPNFWHRIIPASSITAVDMDNVTTKDADAKYLLNISMSGVNVDCKIYFVKRNDCLDLQKKIVKWAFGFDIV